MGTLNRRRVRGDGPRAGGHLNWMGGASYEVSDPIARLRLAASSCFFGEPMYYHRGEGGAPRRGPRAQAAPGAALSDADVDRLRETLHAIDPRAWRGLGPAELLERAIDEALAADPERALGEAARLRNEEHIRATPQVILVRAANHPGLKGTGLVRRHAEAIVRRADEPATGLAYQLARFGKPVPNALKKAWRDALARFGDYELAKYRLASRAVKAVDVVNLTHPKSDAVGRLARGELAQTDRTWEAIVSAKGSNAAAWREALGVMGHMALLRNLRNLLEAGVEPREFVAQLVAGAPRGKQLPFRYYSAYRDYRWGGTNNLDVAKLIAAYREKVNPDVLVFLVQVAGYQDTIVPEFYDKTYVLGGWGEGLLRFAAEMAGLARPAPPPAPAA